jgi:hypothetical protein
LVKEGIAGASDDGVLRHCGRGAQAAWSFGVNGEVKGAQLKLSVTQRQNRASRNFVELS